MTKQEFLQQAAATEGWCYVLIRKGGGIYVHELYSAQGKVLWTANPTGISTRTDKAIADIEQLLADGLLFAEVELEHWNKEQDDA